MEKRQRYVESTDHERALDEWIFLRTMEDLQRRVIAARSFPMADRYSLLGCSILLRKLILDGGQCLARKVNTEYRLKLSFRAHKFDPISALQPYTDTFHGVAKHSWESALICHGDGVVPGKDSSQLLKLSLDSWVGHVTGQIKGERFSIGDLIRFAAHVEGGAHAGPPMTFVERELRSMSHVYIQPVPRSMYF